MHPVGMHPVLTATEHRPYPLPAPGWRMTQRWNDLLFAHWPIPVDAMQALLPPGLVVDPFDHYAWAGVVPFWMDRIRVRAAGDIAFAVPGVTRFPELNLRTYVRSRLTGLAGVYFFSLDAASPLAVFGARTLFHLPYFLASMSRTSTPDGTHHYQSRRRFTRRPVRFEARYRSLGEPASRALPARPSPPGSIEHFLTERYCLFTHHAGRVVVGDIHHLPWPLEPAEAEVSLNELPQAHGITLPNRPPLLHFARSLEVFVWGLRRDTVA